MQSFPRRTIIAGAMAFAAAPAAASTVPLVNPDAELIELGARFVELSRLRDAASDETLRLVDMADERAYAAAEDAFEDAMDQMRATYARMITMRPRTIEGMKAIALAVFHFEWNGIEYAEGAIEGAALAVLVAGLLDKPLPGYLPDWAADWL